MPTVPPIAPPGFLADHPTLIAYSYLPEFLYEYLGRPDQGYPRATPETSAEIFRMAMSTAAVLRALVK